MAKTKHNTL